VSDWGFAGGSAPLLGFGAEPGIFYYYLMKQRSEFYEIYAAFRALVKTQHSVVIKCFRCDLGREYTSNKF